MQKARGEAVNKHTVLSIKLRKCIIEEFNIFKEN